MFRLEKVFQNDDIFFIYLGFFFKSLIIFAIIYIFSILEKNTIYEILDFQLYTNSIYYNLSIFLPIFFLFCNFLFFIDSKYYHFKFKNITKEINIFFLNFFLIFFFFKNSKDSLNLNIELLVLLFLIILFIIFSNFFLFKFYQFLIYSNIIQRNILIVGKYNDVLKILNEKRKLINIYKCCIITDIEFENLKKIRNEIKIPIFHKNEDVRSILEYHHLGQIWVLDRSYDKITIENMIKRIVKFSVDILVINMDKELKKKSQNLINNKYDYINYEISRFYGIKFLIKILLDKILSLIFILLLSPLLIISSILIFLEDGSPIFFYQDRTGWDGRRFKILKLRTLKNTKFDKTLQVTQGDDRVLKIGKFIRKFSIDEVPQFINVLIGDMSIVGPRPHMVEHDIYYSGIFGDFLKRNKSNPGLTGWAQVNGLRGATKDEKSMQKRMEYDLWYLNNWTLWLDIKIIFMTFYALFKYKGD